MIDDKKQELREILDSLPLAALVELLERWQKALADYHKSKQGRTMLK